MPTTSGSTAAATRDGLKGDEIPPIARIVAVAEVYDTLTAPDTYRTPMNSFEALTELRRVAGSSSTRASSKRSSELLAGQGRSTATPTTRTTTRELDIERRMNEAAADDLGLAPTSLREAARSVAACSSDARNASSCSTEKRRWPPGVR